MNQEHDFAVARIERAARDLPEVEASTSYDNPSLKVRKKMLCRVKDPDTVVIMCPLEEKQLLIEVAPEIYFETDHYRGWPSVLVRIRLIPEEELIHRLDRAWRMQAPKTLVKRRVSAAGSG